MLEWSRADTGVGATIAPTSQEENGIKAAFVIPAKLISTAGTMANPYPEVSRVFKANSFPVGSIMAR